MDCLDIPKTNLRGQVFIFLLLWLHPEQYFMSHVTGGVAWENKTITDLAIITKYTSRIEE